MLTNNKNLSSLRFLVLLITVTFLSGCAHVAGPPNPKDPFESYNRAMFAFNDNVDKYLFKPVAETYDEIMPEPVKTGVSNFFSNIGDIFVIINDLLQFKFEQALHDLSRFIFNTTIGLYGIFDVATPMGLEKHHEDFGQTLATWGVGEGPYIVLPFLGSSTIRDTAGLIVDSSYDPIYDIKDTEGRVATVGLRLIDIRYRLLKASRIVDQAALDRYSFVRDAYLQFRKNQVYDGNPPQDKKPELAPATKEDLELELELEKELKL